MSKIDSHIEGHAYSKAAKRAARKARQAQLIEAAARAGVPALAAKHREGNGRATRAAVPRDPQIEMLKARCRRWGRPASKWREMRDPWWGCEAGGAMAKATIDRQDRLMLWDAICHMRRVIVAYDRAIGAPNRHAQCLRLLLPIEELSADAASPAPDERTDEEKQDAAVRQLQWLEEWLGRAGPTPTHEACRAVWDDATPRSVDAMLRALWFVSDGISGHIKRS